MRTTISTFIVTKDSIHNSCDVSEYSGGIWSDMVEFTFSIDDLKATECLSGQ